MIAIPTAAATVTVVPPFSPLFASGVFDEPDPCRLQRRCVLPRAEVGVGLLVDVPCRAVRSPRRRCRSSPSRRPSSRGLGVVRRGAGGGEADVAAGGEVALELRVDEMVRRPRGRARGRCRRCRPWSPLAPSSSSTPSASPSAVSPPRDRRGGAGSDRCGRGDVRDRDRDLRGEREAAAARRCAALCRRRHRVGRRRGDRQVPTPVNAAPSAIPAVVVSLTMLSANEAPSPRAAVGLLLRQRERLAVHVRLAVSVRFPLTVTGRCRRSAPSRRGRRC